MNIHEETLKIARNLIKKDPSLTDWVISKFPELKESEDDSVIKWIINEIRDNMNHEPLSEYKKKAEKAIAWLEKQGEHADFRNKIQIGDKVTRNEDGVLVNLSQLKRVAKPAEEYNITGIGSKNAKGKLGEMIKKKLEMEKQGEQKPVFEMKTPEESLGVDSDTYNKIVDECIYGEQKLADKVEPKFKIKYASSEYNVLEVKDIAGVTYYGIEDEPNHIDYVQAENCERVDGYSIKESGSPFPTKPAKFSEQNSAWSEEDAEMVEGLNNCLDELEEKNGWKYVYVKDKNVELTKVRNWLKLLKERVACEANCTTTKEWSEDEESIINKAESWLDTLCDYLKDSSPEYISDIKDVINKLKSIKDRYTWKPSSIQMECLHKYAEQNNYDGTILTSLYNDLKQL